ncbi:hypothetical protein J1N35_040230 [Gossypium stocksii]|uniref:Uncharacterized protein n=1 Tax=Gossypium stocksii TaxID=47602 RepID=A0A9D3ZI51_9ROSI|nr:hypothetical protein J1N35_040230 [Gossypium stocksii]
MGIVVNARGLLTKFVEHWAFTNTNNSYSELLDFHILCCRAIELGIGSRATVIFALKHNLKWSKLVLSNNLKP